MKLYKKKFLSGLILTGAMFLAVPLMNLMGNHWKFSMNEPGKIFNLDLIEGSINYRLYQAGISGNWDKVVIGKDGWMFLGNRYAQVINQTGGLEIPLTSTQNIEKTVYALKRRQDWLASKEIKTLFAIAPNKHSIYKEYLPDWLPKPDRNSTDRFVAKAKDAGVHVLDLRAPLIKYKAREPSLYYKTGTHWNMLGGLIGYQEVLKEINHRFGMELKVAKIDSIKPLPRSSRVLSWFLKTERKMIDNYEYENDYHVKFNGMHDTVCVQDIDHDTLSLKGDCFEGANPKLNHQDFPRFVLNNHALNDLTLLWLTDSMATNASKLFGTTFSRTFELHHAAHSIDQLQEIIEKHKPDFLLYLVVERDILNPSLQTFFQE